MRRPRHNAHILVPKYLWDMLRRRAEAEQTTMTDLICGAVETYLATKPMTQRRAK